MTSGPGRLQEALFDSLRGKIDSCTLLLDEVTLVVPKAGYRDTMQLLRDLPGLSFEKLIDLAGVDYLHYPGAHHPESRFAVVVHLLSLTHNHRLRVRVFLPNGPELSLPTISDIWPAADWHEREAFDLFGICFEGHRDLRRILTDYDFVGHPLRKDFPVQGHAEVYYDENESKVRYRPVSIVPREITPRVLRNSQRPHAGHGDSLRDPDD